MADTINQRDMENMKLYCDYIYTSKYARWMVDESRRESWSETVSRYCNYAKESIEKRGYSMQESEYKMIYDAILQHEVMPSMRALATAGPALEADNCAAYNCAYAKINRKEVFAEILYILMNGTGMGYSVERQYINKLPEVPSELVFVTDTTIVEDSKYGWMHSFNDLINNLYNGRIIKWDVSKVRPKGALLKTFGGRASGPEYLVNLFQFTIKVFENAKGRRLESIECHDVICKIAEVVVCGGSRRCLVAGTKVLIHSAENFAFSKSIEEIQIGDQVFTDGKIQKVINTFSNGKKACVRVYYQNRYLDCTPDHKIAVLRQFDPKNITPIYDWVQAKDLKSSDYLIEIDVKKPGKPTFRPNKFIRIESLPEHETYDIEVEENHCFFAENILVHNSACLSLSNLSDLRMRNAKSGEWWNIAPYRAYANNSIAYTEKPSMEIFMDEWVSLYKSKSGERGIFNRKAAQEVVKSIGRRDFSHDFGCNPCITADTWIATSRGYFQVSHLIDRKDFDVIVDGRPQKIESNGFFKTGVRQTFEIHLANGIKLRATEEHPIKTPNGFKPVKNLKPGQIICLSNHEKYPVWIGFGQSYDDGLRFKINNCTWTGEMAPEAQSSEFYRGFIENMFNNYATWDNVKKCIKMQFNMYHPILPILQRMLLRCNVLSEAVNTNPNSSLINVLYVRDLVDFRKKFNIKIPNMPAIPSNPPGFVKSYLTTVRSVKLDVVESVYDVTVALVHEFCANGIQISNCSEIILRDCEFCNLTEVIIRPWDTEETIIKKVIIATILGTIQASWTDFNHISDDWKKNCVEEALLGVSLTGIMDNDITSKTSNKLQNLLTKMRQIAIQTNAEWSDKLKINRSAAITTIKPSGTVSQLTNSASGIHTRYAKYYIRTVRGSLNDPLTQFMQKKGIPCEPDVMGSNTMVFSFPIKSPHTSRFRDDMPAIEQLEIWLFYQTYWTEHKPSVTIMVKEHEWLQVAAWVYDHFEKISGVSFLPYDTGVYQQAPYQEVTKEIYESALEKMPKSINWGELATFEKKSNVVQQREYACSGDLCVYA